MKLFFIGAGKMATALASGIVRNRLFLPDELRACDINESSRDAFYKATGVECDANAEKIPEAEAILLAVKPQVAEDAVAALPKLKKNTLVISICAGIPISSLMKWFGTDKIIRVMPNTPLMVGCGASCYALGKGATAEDAKLAGSLLGSLGIAHQVDECQLDAVTGLSGSGPAYYFEMVQALADAGCKVGLPEDLSLELSIQTMAGAAEMLLKKMGTPDSLRIAVTSPHGTTAAGLEVMANAKFRDLMANVVKAATERSVELGKGK